MSKGYIRLIQEEIEEVRNKSNQEGISVETKIWCAKKIQELQEEIRLERKK